jgi:DNA primase
MTNYEAAFETLKSSLRPRLREFLEEEGIKISKNGMLKCINPSHADKNASMKLLSDLNEEQVWCYGCQATGDIFTANYWLNKAPLTGLEFIQENVRALAKKFGIPFEEITLSEEQIERLEQYRFNGIVAEKLTLKDERGQPVNWSHSHCEARGWNLRTCEKLGVATILDYNKLLRDIQHSTGMTIEQIEKKGVSSNLFGPDMITITLFDERGKVVGFTARNTKWTKDSESSKYCNSSHSQVFQKGKILYGMNFVRNSRHRRLDIFEGNGSFITAYAAGHNSCVALCGSSLSDEQVDLIIDMGFSHINLVMDNDPTGKEKTDFYMQKLSGIEGLRVECTRLVFKEEHSHLKDPDDFIRTYSLGEFYKLKPVSAFDWYLEKESEAVKNNQLNPSDFAKKMVKVIYNTENRIDRARQRQKLSEITGVL